MFTDYTGKIIIVKNIKFKDFYDGKYKLTPDKHLIRPCLIISELEDKRYILPISSSKGNEKYLYRKFKLNNDELLINKLHSKDNYVKLDKIIQIEPYYRKPIAELEILQYYKCLLKLQSFYKKINYESKEYELVKQDINRQIKKLKLSI